MDRFVLELRTLAPRQAAVSRFEEAAGQIVPVCADIQHLRIARIDDDVIDEKARSAEIVEQLPVFARVGRCVDLAIERAEVKTIGIRRIYYECANVAAWRSGGTPVVRIK